MFWQFPVMYGPAGAQCEDTHGAVLSLKQCLDAGTQSVSIRDDIIKYEHMSAYDTFGMLEHECVFHVFLSCLRREVRLASLEMLAYQHTFPYWDTRNLCDALSHQVALIVASFCFTLGCQRYGDDGLDMLEEVCRQQVLGHKAPHGLGYLGIVTIFEFLKYAGVWTAVMVVDE